MTGITLAEKIAAVERQIEARREFEAEFGPTADMRALEAVLADLRAMQDWCPSAETAAEKLAAVSSAFSRAGAKDMLALLKARIDTQLNDCLCEMKPDYDDSIVGFNEAWDIVRAIFKEEAESSIRSLPVE